MREFARMDEEAVLDELIQLRRRSLEWSAPLSWAQSSTGPRQARYAILTVLIDILRDGRLREVSRVQ